MPNMSSNVILSTTKIDWFSIVEKNKKEIEFLQTQHVC